MTETEEYFPRGGKKPNLTHFKQSSNFLGAPDKGNKKRKIKKKSENSDGYFSDDGVQHVNVSMTNCAVGISYKTLKDGLLILGRVHKISETKINVMLPCRMKGTVMACHISQSYNKLLEAYVNDQVDRIRELPNMFKPGQYVALKVIEIEKDQIMLSMMPQHVNGGKTHADLQKGALLQAAVSSVEDHGCVMDIGIPNTRAFLPTANTNPQIELDTGVITWCCVKSVSPSSDNTVVTLTNELSSLQKSVLRKKPSAPLLPGTTFEFTVDEPLDNGIEGHIFEDSTSYIQRQHTDTVNGKKPRLGQKIRAHLLYVMPTRNTPFLQMKNIFETAYPDLAKEQKYREGDIINDAKVIKVTGRSITFRLGEGSTGTMSVQRVQAHEEFSDEQILSKSYPTGSVHSVRVICYHMSDFVYVVTDETSLLREPHFTLRDVKAGDIVRGKVREIRDNNFLLINIGRLIGYVPKTHFCDTGVFVDPKKPSSSKILKKFKVGQEVKARVLSVNEDKNELHCTLKPSLLDPELEILDSYDQKHVGKAYTGTIKFVHNQYVLVSFFNDVKGYVSRSHCSRDPEVVLRDIYHLGQIVKCTITKVDVENKKMIASFNIPPFTPSSEQNGKSGKHKRKSDNTEITSKKKKLNEDSASDDEVVDDVQEKHKKKSKKLDRKKSDNVSESSDVAAEDSDAIEVDIAERKKKKKKGKNMDEIKVTSEDSDEPEADSKEEIKKKRKKKDKVSQNIKVSDESDPIDTDLPESDNDILTPQDQGLMDISDCITQKQCKKRVQSLLKAVKARNLRRKRIEHKIARIEEEGLNPKNKIFHTAMQSEKIVVLQRIEKLKEALSIAQEKLKEVKRETSLNKKKDKKESKEKGDGDEADKDKPIKIDVKKIKDSIKIVEDMKPVMEVPSAKDFWSMDIEKLPKNTQEEESSSSSDEEIEDQPKKKRKKLTPGEKVKKAREEEERVRELERVAVESEARPHSSEQFERALLASPHSSQLWIAYMAFHLQATELDKARAVCRRALNTISFREEDEKLNVWVAAINIENRFGTKETQQKILEEALQMNEPYKVHLKLLDIYVETSQQQELSALVDLMMRKYKRQEEVYTQCGDACYRAGLLDKARHVMQRAMAVLDKKQHVAVLVQFALLERRLGAAERADALLEQVLAVYPQRVDVCSVYVDMLLKARDLNKIRQLMERMTSQKLPARKIKVLYKKWIEVEEKIGDKQEAESIRQRALEYINKAKF